VFLITWQQKLRRSAEAVRSRDTNPGWPECVWP